MKVTLNWLRQYVDFDWSPEDLAERLTMLGLEVEGVQKLGGEFEGIVVAQVLTRDKVPGSDKLSVCKVNDGKGERTIICGAQNHQLGHKVPLILPNFALPLKPGEKEPFVIKERKVFGITSQGMMCSPKELGLADEAEGLLILREDAKVGQPFAEYMGRTGSDVVYDLEITPNRPDLNSIIGIAREIAAVTGNVLTIPAVSFQPAAISTEKTESLVAVRLEAPELCPRYTARVVKGVKIGPSPDWLRRTLEKVGLRSINNVVDVTNYVLMESGQPLHAFDFRLIAFDYPMILEGHNKPTIVIRRAASGEKFKTLDNQERTLTTEMLLIADEQKGIALAGVMGGANTEINERTNDVLIESAYFSPTNIRRTSKALGLRTDASYRFERGCDISVCDWASQRAAQLILETAGGQLADGVVDAYPNPVEPKQITLRHHKVSELLGIQLKPEEIEYYLGQLGLKAVNRKVRSVGDDAPLEPVTFRIPTFRVDLKRETDLIEEVCRLHGVEKISSTAPRGAIGTNDFDAVYDQIADVRRLLTGLGLHEAQGQTLVGKDEVRGMRDEEIAALANPLSSDMDVLRPSLLPGLLNVLRHNISRKNCDVAVFEIGRVFTQSSGKTQEERRVAIALAGQRALPCWTGGERDAKFDAMDLKGIVEDLLEHFGLKGVVFSKRNESTPLFLESAAFMLGVPPRGMPLGELGQLLPTLAKQCDLRDAVFLAELRLDELLARRNASKSFKPLPEFPAVRRDVAMLVPEATTHDAVLAVVKQTKPANLESVELFDVFRGKNVPDGQKSLAYAFTYRASGRTLKDEEVNAAQAKVVEALKQKLQAAVRE
ncbi:MAG: phenylalanine--tRNA ligase subunit beta [Verrucomicrobia bacterium]|nr:phenylalanine--tRNA ligase subunit beta [Verrucomicrobiota bacterium]